MISKLKLLIVLTVVLFSSCKSKDTNIPLPISFGLQENEQSFKRQELVKNNVLRLLINEKGDTTYFRDLNINSTNYETIFKINFDHLGFGGPLRSYTYALFVTPYSKSGNDTANVPKWYLEDKICLSSTFSTIKSFLDEKYGTPALITKIQNVLLNKDDTSFKYSLDTIDIYLTHSPTVSNDKYKVNFKEQFYDRGYITITSKSYFREADKEANRRISLLFPEEVLEVRFNNAEIKNIPDENGYPRINLTANSEDFKTDLVDADIIEAKGILTCKDIYNDNLLSQEISYKFDPPLVRHGKIGKSREWFMQSFSISPLGEVYSKIYDQLSQGRTVKVNFKPTAVVFDDGTVIK